MRYQVCGGDVIRISGKEAERKFLEEDTASKSEPALAPGEGELRVVDKAFGRQPAVLVRGDEAGAEAALGLLSEHFPELWEIGKEHASRSRRSATICIASFRCDRRPGKRPLRCIASDRWADEVKKSPVRRAMSKCKVLVDVADAGLADLVRSRAQAALGVAE